MPPLRTMKMCVTQSKDSERRHSEIFGAMTTYILYIHIYIIYNIHICVYISYIIYNIYNIHTCVYIIHTYTSIYYIYIHIYIHLLRSIRGDIS